MQSIDTKQFSQGWFFHSGDTPWWESRGERLDIKLNRWHEVNLPHCFNADDTFTPSRGFYRGVCWYRKTFTVPERKPEQRVFIEFGAAFSLADVWINEQHAGQFMGGFTGFAVDATEFLGAGDNLIAVKVDSSHHPDILPGIDAQLMDYTLYGGLYREASLIVKDALHIPRNGVTVTTPSVAAEKATIQVSVAIENARAESGDCTCTAVLRDAEGTEAARMQGRTTVAGRSNALLDLEPGEVASPALWSIDSPNLYTLDVTLECGADADSESVAVGFRWFEFVADDGFFLNGEHVKLRGLNRHQDYPGLGNALPPRLQVRDAEILKEMGVNFVRSSHYPQHPAFIDACDRLGIIVYEEIASWQYIGGEVFTRNAEYMMREMIARDKNHPSVILWGLLNEGRSKPLFERLHRVAKECDPTRPTIYAENHPAEGKELGSVFVPDVLGLNYGLPHLDDTRAALPDLRFLSSETSNYEHRLRGDFDHDVAQVRKHKIDTDIIEERAYMAGMALWCMHDYGTDYELSWPIQNSGVLDEYRLPKAGYWFLRCRWSSEPLVRIVGHWNWPGREGKSLPVLVCANGASVELFLNDESLGIKSEPFLNEWYVPYTPGTLRAVATVGGETVEHQVVTAGEPAGLHIETSETALAADGADVAEITITVVDAKGNPVLCENGHAVFRVEGPGIIHGAGGIPCTRVLAGTGRVVVRSTPSAGTVTVRAAYRGLPEAAVTVKTE